VRCVIRLALLICFAVAGLNMTPAEARRVALVIGNAEHQFLPVLKNPVNDATAMAEALEKLNFDKVILKKDLGIEGFRTALRELSREAQGAEVGMIFFAGNGIQVDGRNYLIPVDAKLEKRSDVDLDAIRLETVIEQLADAKLGLVILDACRDDPFVSGRYVRGQNRGLHRGGSKGKGLARIEPRHNLFLVYAAQPGAVALDGVGHHSPFTEALLKHLPTPGLELRHLFIRVRSEVLAATGGQQGPHVDDSFLAEFYFKAAQ